MAGRKKCSVAGCINRVKAYGICATHHDRKKAGWPDWDTRPIASKRRLNYGRFTDYEPWEYSLLKHYGIEKGGYERLLEAQGGRCGICSRVACPTGRRFAVDYCHRTGRIRGLLCVDCNQALGKFGDDPDILMSAVRYLSEPSNPALSGLEFAYHARHLNDRDSSWYSRRDK
ncbi:endonuclease VII [Mycobacterium phage xkcd]|nr:endonuclease VII [Mycobacterium phage xkcd]